MVRIQEFIQHTYHFVTEVITTDSVLRIVSKKGSVVILSEERYNTMMKIMEENMIDK